jgi:quinol monooxygenase YgiN
MSVIVIGRMQVEPANVAKLFSQRKADFEGIRKEAEAAGAQHHRWGFGDGEVVIIDEWNDAASFHTFFGSHTVIADLMQEAGVQGPPEFTILEAEQAPDEF